MTETFEETCAKAVDMTVAQFRAWVADGDLRDAFLAGFQASSEGWNGEIVRDSGETDSELWDRDLRDRFAKWKQARRP